MITDDDVGADFQAKNFKVRRNLKNKKLIETAEALRGDSKSDCSKHQMLTIVSSKYEIEGRTRKIWLKKCINCGYLEWFGGYTNI